MRWWNARSMIRGGRLRTGAGIEAATVTC